MNQSITSRDTGVSLVKWDLLYFDKILLMQSFKGPISCKIQFISVFSQYVSVNSPEMEQSLSFVFLQSVATKRSQTGMCDVTGNRP